MPPPAPAREPCFGSSPSKGVTDTYGEDQRRTQRDALMHDTTAQGAELLRLREAVAAVENWQLRFDRRLARIDVQVQQLAEEQEAQSGRHLFALENDRGCESARGQGHTVRGSASSDPRLLKRLEALETLCEAVRLDAAAAVAAAATAASMANAREAANRADSVVPRAVEPSKSLAIDASRLDALEKAQKTLAMGLKRAISLSTAAGEHSHALPQQTPAAISDEVISQMEQRLRQDLRTLVAQERQGQEQQNRTPHRAIEIPDEVIVEMEYRLRHDLQEMISQGRQAGDQKCSEVSNEVMNRMEHKLRQDLQELIAQARQGQDDSVKQLRGQLDSQFEQFARRIQEEAIPNVFSEKLKAASFATHLAPHLAQYELRLSRLEEKTAESTLHPHGGNESPEKEKLHRDLLDKIRRRQDLQGELQEEVRCHLNALDTQLQTVKSDASKMKTSFEASLRVCSNRVGSLEEEIEKKLSSGRVELCQPPNESYIRSWPSTSEQSRQQEHQQEQRQRELQQLQLLKLQEDLLNQQRHQQCNSPPIRDAPRARNFDSPDSLHSQESTRVPSSYADTNYAPSSRSGFAHVLNHPRPDDNILETRVAYGHDAESEKRETESCYSSISTRVPASVSDQERDTGAPQDSMAKQSGATTPRSGGVVGTLADLASSFWSRPRTPPRSLRQAAAEPELNPWAAQYCGDTSELGI